MLVFQCVTKRSLCCICKCRYENKPKYIYIRWKGGKIITKCQQLVSLSEDYTGVYCTIFSTVDLKIFKQKGEN